MRFVVLSLETSQILRVFEGKTIQNSEQFQLAVQRYLERLGDLFSLPTDSHYFLTAALAHNTLYEHSKKAPIQFIKYPSVVPVSEAFNLVFHPSVIEKGDISLDKVFEIQIANISDIEITVHQLSEGININGCIRWLPSR